MKVPECGRQEKATALWTTGTMTRKAFEAVAQYESVCEAQRRTVRIDATEIPFLGAPGGETDPFLPRTVSRCQRWERETPSETKC